MIQTFLDGTLGFEGYRRVQQECRDMATYVSGAIAELGPFELITDGSELPVFAFKVRDEVEGYSAYDVARVLVPRQPGRPRGAQGGGQERLQQRPSRHIPGRPEAVAGAPREAIVPGARRILHGLFPLKSGTRLHAPDMHRPAIRPGAQGHASEF